MTLLQMRSMSTEVFGWLHKSSGTATRTNVGETWSTAYARLGISCSSGLKIEFERYWPAEPPAS